MSLLNLGQSKVLPKPDFCLENRLNNTIDTRQKIFFVQLQFFKNVFIFLLFLLLFERIVNLTKKKCVLFK